ncbi:hypothetical protein [Streptomyces crystallinus]|uniref:Uncharacterized protein n=1 Tax=Streptomyces crystallinus TaxID=68191 RepID=A0ABN1F0X4_9ACTN
MWVYVRYHGRDVDPIEPLNEMVAEIEKYGIVCHLRPARPDVFIASGDWANRMRIFYDNSRGIFVSEIIPHGECEWRQAGFLPPTSNARYFAQRTFRE